MSLLNRLQQQRRSYTPLQNEGPLAPRARNEAGLGKRLKGFRVRSRNHLVDKGLLESRQQKHDRRVARQQAFLAGFALILNEHGGAAAWQTVLDDQRLRSMAALKPIKQPKPEGDQPRQVTRIGLEVQDGQVLVCQQDASLGETVDLHHDADEGVQPLAASASKNLRAALISYVTSGALEQQGF